MLHSQTFHREEKVRHKEQLEAITIYKESEVLSSWNGSNFIYEKKKLTGATFKVTAGADIYKADGTKVYLEVCTWNIRAVKCYQKAGFRIDGQAYELTTGIGTGTFYRMIRE